MIIYFEDGPIANESIFLETGAMIKVDAGMGYSNCRRQLRNIDKNFSFDTKVYTNSLDAFSNYWCWDDEKKMPMIYIRDEYGEWKLISEFTDRELRMAHNLEKLYVNGAFCSVEV